MRRKTEPLALAAVMNYCLSLFLHETTLRIPYTDLYHTVSYAALVVIGLFRLGTGLFSSFRKAGSVSEKLRVLLLAAFCVGSVLVCCVPARRYGYAFLVYLPFVAFCLWGMEPERVLKVYAACLGAALIAIVLCALSGSIQNYLYLGHGRKGRIRGAYGSIYPTDFASCFVYLFLCFWCVRKRRGKADTALLFCLALGMAYFLYVYPRSETSTICSLLIAIVVLYTGFTENFRLGKGKFFGGLTRVTDGLAVAAFPLFGTVMWILTVLYGHGNAFAVRMDQALSGRLHLVWEAFLKYGIHFFGTLTPQSGWGNGLIHLNSYEFLDSSYALLPIRYGWVFTLIAGAAWVWMTRKALRSGRRHIAYAMAVIAFHSFSEHHFPELNYNLFLVLPLCCFAGKRQEAEEKVEEKHPLSGWIAGAVTIALAVILLPRGLSWARCLFAQKGWTGGGESSLPAFLFCLGWLAAFLLLFVFLRKAIADWKGARRRARKSLVPLLAVVCVAVACGVWMNGQVGAYAASRPEQMEAERSSVEAVLEAASEPVYAGQEEEVYKRFYPGFSDRVLSAEETARSGRGSVLLEHGNEGYQLIETGALYTELSPYTGLFTYDSSVVEALEEKGFRFHGYYSAEREVDLPSLAEANGATVVENGGLLLSGEGASLTHGLYLDQYEGTYTVTYTLWLTDRTILDDEEDNRELCTLKVSALWGQETLAEKVITAWDFDYHGELTESLTYTTGGTRGVDFQVRCRDGVQIRAAKITWRKTPDHDVRRTYTPEGYLETVTVLDENGEALEEGP